MSTEMIRQPNQAAAIYAKIENPMQAIAELGKMFHTSQIMGVATPGDGAVLALTCMCEGITPLEFARTYHIISGKPSMRADMMHAKFRGAGGKVKWINTGDDGSKAAEAEFTFDGQTLVVRFTLDDARKLLGKDKNGKDRIDSPDSNWQKDAPAMLRARLITKAIRILAPELIAGVYTPEEISDYQPILNPTITASQPKESELATRRAELLAQSADPVIDAVIEPAQCSQVNQEPAAESAPFETTETVDLNLCTQAQRQELFKLMQMFGNKMNPQQTFTADQVAEQIVAAGKGAFTQCTQAPKDLLDRMITLIRSKI